MVASRLWKSTTLLLSVRVNQSELTQKIGFRDLRVITEKDAVGSSMVVTVNGRPISCKGANWIPADALLGKITREKTRSLLDDALTANINMIRVCAGGMYKHDYFYRSGRI